MADVDNDTDDDFLTNPGDEDNPMYQMKKDEKLPGDYDTPFSPPQGAQDRIDSTYPLTDTNVQPEEDYDEGIEGASGGDFPGEAAEEDQDLPDTEGE